MTAPLLSNSFEPSVSQPFSDYSPNTNAVMAAHRSTKKLIAMPPVNQLSINRSRDTEGLNALMGGALELIPQGIVIVSRQLKPVYWNRKAKEISQTLMNASLSYDALPASLAEVCHRFIRNHHDFQNSLICEWQPICGQTLRITAQWIDGVPFNAASDPEPFTFATGRKSSTAVSSEPLPGFLALLIEHCNASMEEDIRIQRQKYDLTEREAEIWMLLQQEYSYQEIAQLLQISLNTVKTHVKNVYAKRRSAQEANKFWCCD